MKLEARRQFLHFFFGCIVILTVALIGAKYWILLNAGILALGLAVSLLIKKKKITPFPFIGDLLSLAGRHSEKQMPGKGAIMFFAGTLLVSIIFYPYLNILLGSMIVLVFGDSISTVIGKSMGKFKLVSKRTLEGTASGIFFSFLFLSLLFAPGIAIITAIIGMFAEYLPINDNISIPLISGFVLLILV